MEWKNPQVLYLILPCCLAWLGLALFSEQRRQRARETFVARSMWDRILPEPSPLRFAIKQLLQLIAIAAGLIAMAGPRFGTEIEQIIPRGSDLYVLIDVSRSMLAEDVKPSRLGRAKADVSGLVNRLEGERIGLIAFAGQAVVKCPLTVDYDSFRRALQELDPSSAPRGGTAIGDAIRKALEVFQGKTDRDQAILLITDGDDQQSYPLEAAAAAAEKHVTIFTVGLGDTEQGARIPQASDTKNFVEYEGKQVWSKMDGNLLSEIALKTSGVYVPAGTKSYDLGELYSNHLQDRRSETETNQERSRRSEQFQLFLAISFIALIADALLSPYRRRRKTAWRLPSPVSRQANSVRSIDSPRPQKVPALAILAAVALGGSPSQATDPPRAIREGIQQYARDDFEAAREKFAAAAAELEKRQSQQAAIAAFDEACAYHRRGESEKARESYLRAGLSQDRDTAVAAHFNLGNLSAEQARSLSGEQPEEVAPDKREEIIELLMQATGSYRHCLELQPEHPQARSNLELVRQWIKFYADRWRERDRQKRRDESNLLAFLEFLLQTQSGLRASLERAAPAIGADELSELKQTQSELAEEIPTLKKKIDEALQPARANQPNAPPPSDEDTQQIAAGLQLLHGHANAALKQMLDSRQSLDAKDTAASLRHQQQAIDELDKIWEVVIPFHPLLAKELADQTGIAKQLAEETASDESDLASLLENQQRALRRARLLAPKAEMELAEWEQAQTKADSANDPQANAPVPDPPASEEDSAAIRGGFEKAIELAPQAAQHMESAVDGIEQKDRLKAANEAEEARKILEEIQKAQPKQKNESQSDEQDRKQSPSDQEKKPDQDSQDKANPPQDKNDSSNEEKKPDDKPSQAEEKKEPSADQQQNQSKPSPTSLSQDRIEEALRKVRERQEEKRENDRELKARILGRLPVDKDW